MAQSVIYLKDRRVNACAYNFHVHLNHRIHRRLCLFKDSHPPVLCVSEE